MPSDEAPAGASSEGAAHCTHTQKLYAPLARIKGLKLELLHHEQDPGRFEDRRADLEALPACPIGPEQWRRALDVQQQLALRGGALHRSVPSTDYVIAAAAEAAGLIVLHYDRDYDTLAQATGQQTEWIAERGSL